MKALVTGAAGFIGRNLTRALLKEGWEVLCVDLRLPTDAEKHPHLTWLALDCREGEALKAADVMQDVDVIFHLAGLTRAISAQAFMDANVKTTQLFLDEVLRTQRSLKRFVLISSQAAAGPAPAVDSPLDEASIPRPVEAYGRSKLEAEARVKATGDTIPYTIIRPGGVYGPGDRDFLLLLKSLKWGLGIFPGNWNNWFSPVYIDDLVEGLIKASVAEAAKNQCYFLCNETPYSWREVYGIMARHAGFRYISLRISGRLLARIIGWVAALPFIKSVPPVDAHKISLALDPFWVATAVKARRDFGFNPVTPVEEGFQKTIVWYRANHKL